MKKYKVEKLIKVRNKFTNEVYETSNDWETKNIDGVTFIKVLRNGSKTQHLMKKDSLERIN